jgi:hypothetical protein
MIVVSSIMRSGALMNSASADNIFLELILNSYPSSLSFVNAFVIDHREVYFIHQRSASYNICIALVKFTVSTFLWSVGAPKQVESGIF